MAATRVYTEQELRALGVYFYKNGRPRGICSANGSAIGGGGDLDLRDTASIITAMTPEQKIAQTFVVGFAPSQTDVAKQIVSQYKIGGIAIIGRSVDVAPAFTKAYFDSLNVASGNVPVMIAADQEGGSVQRFADTDSFKAALGGVSQPSAKTLGAGTATQAEAIGKQVGLGLTSVGVTVALAPVLDVDDNNPVNSISSQGRSFSTDPNVVIEKAGAFAKGLQAGGVSPMFKHFPGHGDALLKGSATGNSDNGIAVTPPLASLKTKDLIPYQQLANQFGAGVMLGNLIVPGLTENDKTPASISPATVNLLRNNYGFNGLIMTDDLHAGAITAQGISLPDAIRRSLAAGVDAPLFTFTSEADIQAAIAAVKAQVPGAIIDAAAKQMLDFKFSNTSTTATVTASPTGTPSALGAGSKVYILGDSISLRTKEEYTAALQAKGISATIDASSSRSIDKPGIDGNKLSGMAAIAADTSVIQQSNAVVIELGTNGGDTPQAIDKTIAAVRAANPNLGSSIYWVDTFGINGKNFKTAEVKAANQAIYGESKTQNFQVISWFKTIDPTGDAQSPVDPLEDTNSFIDSSDGLGVHPTAAGQTALANIVVGAIVAGTGTPDVINVTSAIGNCCPVSVSATSTLNSGGQITGTFHGGTKTLPPSWIPILSAAGKDIGVDPAFLAAILGIESSWVPPEAFLQNPELDNNGIASGPFQFVASTAVRYRTPANDGNHDGVTDEKNPTDAAYMAAAHLKSMGAGLDTPLGNEGDYGFAKNNADGKVTIRTIAAHYNQGGAFSIPDGTTKDVANQITKNKNGNLVGDYMDSASLNTGAIRQSGVFSSVSGTPQLAATGCSGGSDFTANSFIVYDQSDPRWANLPYGDTTIAATGCGPAAMAMIITALTGKPITPDLTAAYGAANGTYDTNNDQSNSNIASVLAPNWGLKAAKLDAGVSTINTSLQAGGLVILAGTGPDPFTTQGHYIVIRGVTPSGNWKVGDSFPNATDKAEYNPAEVMSLTSPGSVYVVSK